jgi:ribonuclease HII
MVESHGLQDLLGYEAGFWSRGFSRVAGVDEAGRGPLAGPVVAAAVVLPPGMAVEGARDSKTLSPARRQALAAEILDRAAAVGLGAASVSEIDRFNILVSTRLAMARALARLPLPPEHVVVDGRPVKDLPWDHEAIVGGDARVHSIACASIVAKVVRDRLMKRLALRYPGYGWETNMGYGTAEHRRALSEMGPTPHHRRTFGPVQGELDL